MAKQTTHIRRHLRASTPVAALLDEIERREQLLHAVRGCLPQQLAGHCRQAALADGELILFVDSPVWVDRFRYCCSDLVGGLVADGLEVERCRIRVLPRSALPVSGQQAPRPEPRRANQPAGVEGASPIARALSRLAKTLGCGREG